MFSKKDSRTKKHTKLDQVTWKKGKSKVRYHSSKVKKVPFDECSSFDFKNPKTIREARLSIPEETIYEMIKYPDKKIQHGCSTCNTFLCHHMIQRNGALYFLLCYETIEPNLPKEIALIIAKLIYQGYSYSCMAH